MYAVVDIETTGGRFNEEAITEIAVYRFDGHEVVDQFASLVNPERPIQPFVQKLTGINEKMLRNAPRFFEIAKRVIEITSDCVIVAHNAEFDYRMLRTEFQRLGYTYERDSLCTVQLSEQLLPEQESYKLGKLVRSLGIPISDRHRAHGDARATLKLFQMLLEKDSNKSIVQTQIKTLFKNNLADKHLKILEEIPAATGVYYFYNKAKELLYIGKSKNIQKRIRTHFTSPKGKSLKLQKLVHQVRFEKTGNELLALLKEQNEIKINRPKFNYAFKFRLFPMGIRIETDSTGYQHLLVEQARQEQDYLMVFKNKKAAVGRLFHWIEHYQLCQNKTSLANGKTSCPTFSLKQCDGACTGKETPKVYNAKVETLLTDLSFPHPSFLLIDEGRTKGEKSFVWVEEERFKGYGFFELHHQIKTVDRIAQRCIAVEHNPDCAALIRSFLGKKKYQKLIPLSPDGEQI
jgi:DNA polymerase-3 subunit epsilon